MYKNIVFYNVFQCFFIDFLVLSCRIGPVIDDFGVDYGHDFGDYGHDFGDFGDDYGHDFGDYGHDFGDFGADYGHDFGDFGADFGRFRGRFRP